jgi:hypothetical protein
MSDRSNRSDVNSYSGSSSLRMNTSTPAASSSLFSATSVEDHQLHPQYRRASSATSSGCLGSMGSIGSLRGLRILRSGSVHPVDFNLDAMKLSSNDVDSIKSCRMMKGDAKVLGEKLKEAGPGGIFKGEVN